MTSRDFAFWLQGSFEISDSKELDARQVSIIKKHLALVFKHEIDPSMGSSEHQEELNSIHNVVDKEQLYHTKNNPLPWTKDIDDGILRC